MEAGELRHLITVERFDGTQDELGDPLYRQDGHWVTVCRRFANVTTLSSREFLAVQQMQGEVTGKVVMRWIDGIRSDMRIRWKNHIYLIQGPPVKSGEWMTIMVREVEPGGQDQSASG